MAARPSQPQGRFTNRPFWIKRQITDWEGPLVNGPYEIGQASIQLQEPVMMIPLIADHCGREAVLQRPRSQIHPVATTTCYSKHIFRDDGTLGIQGRSDRKEKTGGVSPACSMDQRFVV